MGPCSREFTPMGELDDRIWRGAGKPGGQPAKARSVQIKSLLTMHSRHPRASGDPVNDGVAGKFSVESQMVSDIALHCGVLDPRFRGDDV